MARKLEVVITGDTQSLERAFGRAGGATETFGHKFTAAANRAANVAGIAIAAAAAYELGTAFQTVAEKATLLAETNAIIESTGGAAGVTSEHVVELADSLEKMSLADDTAIQKGENLLLTFKNIQNQAGEGNDIFDQATQVMVDMSQVMGQDVTQTAIQVGKALNDPIGGVTALRRVGVQLSDQQEQQIKDFMAVGDVMSAQKVILQELNSEFGGAAAAAQDSKPWDLLKDNLDDLAEKFAGIVMPRLMEFTKFLNENLQPALLGTAGVVGVLGSTLLGLKAGSLAVSLGLASSAGPFGLFGAALAVTVGQIVILWTQWDRIKQKFSENSWLLAPAVAIISLVSLFNPVIRTIITVIALIKEWGTISSAVSSAFQSVVSFVVAAVSGAIGFFGSLPARMLSIAQGIMSSVISGLSQLPYVVGYVFGYAAGLAVNAIVSLVGWLWGSIPQIPGIVASGLAALPGVASAAFWGVVNVAWGAMSGLVGAVGSGVSWAVGVMAGLPGQLLSALGDVGSLLYGAGRMVVQGLIDGITSMAGAAWDAISGLASGLQDGFMAAIGAASPSRVFMRVAELIPQGVALGIANVSGVAIGAVKDMARLMVEPMGNLQLAPAFVASGNITSGHPTASRTGSRGANFGDVYFAAGAIVVNGASGPEATADAIYRKLIEKLEREGRYQG